MTKVWSKCCVLLPLVFFYFKLFWKPFAYNNNNINTTTTTTTTTNNNSTSTSASTSNSDSDSDSDSDDNNNNNNNSNHDSIMELNFIQISIDNFLLILLLL